MSPSAPQPSTSTFLPEIENAHAAPHVRERFAALARSNAGSHLRDSGPVHFTASAIVIDQDRTHLALHFHRKVRAWLQFGGHIEPGESSFLEAALREAREESGLHEFEVVGQAPLRLHAHELNSNFAACSEHWDVQYLLRVPFTARDAHDGLRVSNESDDLSWFPVGSLPDGLVDDLYEVIEGPVRAAAHRSL